MTPKSLFIASLGVLSTLAAARSVHAHGPVIQLSITDNTVTTRGIFLDDSTGYGPLLPAQRIFQVPMVQRSLGDANDGWYAQPGANANLGPGVAYGIGGFSPGVNITQSFVDGLKWWNGSAFVDPGTEQLQGFRSSNILPAVTLTTTDTAPFQSYTLALGATISANSHAQNVWRLAGDGVSPTSASKDGVYLATFTFSTSQPGVATSLPVYFLLTKNAAGSDIAGAAGYLNTTAVPEPGSLLLLASGTALFLTARRRMV